MTSSLQPATALAQAASRPYPNDSRAYREARTALLAEEIELRRHIERVAEQRRALPPGGVAADHEFRDENGKTVGWKALFGAHDTLVTYFWMYGPQRERPCPMCTAFIGALADNGSLGPALTGPAVGYAFVYHLEIGLLFAALVAIGPLARHASTHPHSQPNKFGIAEFPT